MNNKVVCIALIACCAMAFMCYAEDVTTDKGIWPKGWPQELEPLRKQSRTVRSGLAELITYEIPFAKRQKFESAWPHLLTIKSKGAPILLLRGPNKDLGTQINAGVRINCPPSQGRDGVTPAEPLPGVRSIRERWLWTRYIELVVDGVIVDLNRIPLPGDTPIIDMRFGDGKSK